MGFADINTNQLIITGLIQANLSTLFFVINLVAEVARQFVLANCYDPEAAMKFFDDQ